MVTRGMDEAEKQFKAKKLDSCKSILDILDLDFLSDMEAFIGNIATKTQYQHYNVMKKKLHPPTKE